MARARQPGSAPSSAVAGRRRFWLVVALALLIAGAAGYAFRQPLLVRLGHALVAADPLEKADAALVLADDGSFESYRLRAAAYLHREGWVRKVILSGAVCPYRVSETELALPLAVSLGIPKSDIIAVPNATRFIDQEAELLLGTLESQRIRSLYVITANYQTRRARRIFQRTAGRRLRVLAYPAKDDGFDPGRRWQSRDGRKILLMECLGLHSRE
jgi:uncharacterized SAM-binding protein YcdF (DUF218 family)